MQPDITIYNATTTCPVIVGHTPAGLALLSRHCDMENGGWICIGRVNTNGHRRFRALHEKIIAAHLVVHYDQATGKRLDKLTGGAYSAMARRIV